MSLNDSVKLIARGYIESLKLADVVFATVTRAQPLEVSVDQRYTLEADFLVVPEHLTEYRLTIDGSEVVIRRGLETGDKVILLRQQGGLHFVVAGRLTT